MTVLFAAMLLGHQQTLSSNDIIAKSLAKYAASNSGIGEFVMNQSAGSKKVSVKSSLQFVRPSKIYLHQSSEQIVPNDWLLVSDGVNFGYDVPGAPTGPRRRLFEPVAIVESATGNKKVLPIQSIYMAAKRSLGDTINPFIEFGTASAGDTQSLKGFLSRLTNIKPATEKTLADGTSVYFIQGIMQFGNRQLDKNGVAMVDKDGNAMFESAGRFELSISKDFDLVSLRTVENVSITEAATNLPTQINVVTTWTGKLQLDATPDDKIFTVK